MPKKSFKTVDVIFTDNDKLLTSIVSSVKRGFAKNYLFPQRKAIPATKENISIAEKKLVLLREALKIAIEQAEKTKRKINNARINIIVEVDEQEHLYGSLKLKDMIDEIEKLHSITLDKKMFIIDTKIKTTGVYPVNIQLHNDVQAIILLNVHKKDDNVKNIWTEYDNSQK